MQRLSTVRVESSLLTDGVQRFGCQCWDARLSFGVGGSNTGGWNVCLHRR